MKSLEEKKGLSKPSSLCKIQSNLPPDELFHRQKLQFAFIKINDICNAKCSFCDIWQKQINHHKDIDWSQTTEDLIDLGASDVNIHGGEAFLSKAFFQILECAQKRLSFSITTNGILLKRFYDRLFAANNLSRIYVSIDHYDPKLNAKSRGIPQLETELFPILQKIRTEKRDVELVVNHVVSSYNYDSIDLMLIKMKEIGIHAVNLIPIKDTPHLFLNREQIAIFYEKIQRVLSQGQIEVSYFLNQIYEIFGKQDAWLEATQGIYNSQLKKACIIPSAVLFIDGPTGNVYPCDTTLYRQNKEQYIMGNILETPLKEIWEGERYKIFRKKMYPRITCNCIQGCDPANTIINIPKAKT